MNKYLLMVSALALALGANAQQGKLTAKDYDRAERFMSYNTEKFIDGVPGRLNWLDNDKFWYTVKNQNGSQTFLVDPLKKTKTLTTAYTAETAPAQGGRRFGNRNEVVSPDGKKAVFIKDWNLWVRDVESKKETQLTTDGIKDYGYATDNAGWTMSDGPIVRWSPDSKKVATFQQDQRNVSDMYLVTTNVGAPVLKAWKYPCQAIKPLLPLEE